MQSKKAERADGFVLHGDPPHQFYALPGTAERIQGDVQQSAEMKAKRAKIKAAVDEAIALDAKGLTTAADWARMEELVRIANG